MVNSTNKRGMLLGYKVGLEVKVEKGGRRLEYPLR